ncbi:MAG TPA: aminodeoxychorismate lyase [Methylotenera sp.]|nr:aminodeoxychorismate lyase [Methylotenera sp.]
MAHTHLYLVNGSFNQTISPFDRGFAYGDGVFRTIKMVGGLPQHWPQHYQKLVADCAAINIVCPSAELLMSDLSQLFLADTETEYHPTVAKIIITRGEGNRGYTPPAITAPMRVVLKSDMPDYPESRFSEGVTLTVCETRLATQPKLAGIKHLNRLENVLARMEWHNPDIAEGLMLDMHDNVIECTAANIFARFGDALITPDLQQCGVAGITRQRIIEIAPTLSLKPNVETFNLEKLYQADEVVICNSLYGAWQVKAVQAADTQQMIKTGALSANIRAALRSL